MSRAVKGWDEQDAFTGWRRVLHFRPGQIRRIKRRAAKRERREAHRATLEHMREWQEGRFTHEGEES